MGESRAFSLNVGQELGSAAFTCPFDQALIKEN